jgi:ADP-ribosyl-[dinitrogen reductase] hydrolase
MKRSTLLGLAIGDALGQPFEFSNTKKILESKWDGNFVSGLVWKLGPGQYTDDGKMGLCIANSLVEKKGWNAEDVALKYVQWVESGDLRGIGMTCERAINKLSNGSSIKESGVMNNNRAKPSFKRIGVDPLISTGDFCGNGTVMRVAPIGLFFRNDLKQLEIAAKEDATITHDHPDARDASYALANIIALLANGSTRYDAIFNSLELNFEFTHIKDHILTALNMKITNIEEVGNILGTRGTAHETLASAIYCFGHNLTFEDSVREAVLMGGDTDTRAAITGALAGTFYGLERIPKHLIDGVEDSEKLQELDNKLYTGKL